MAAILCIGFTACGKDNADDNGKEVLFYNSDKLIRKWHIPNPFGVLPSNYAIEFIYGETYIIKNPIFGIIEGNYKITDSLNTMRWAYGFDEEIGDNKYKEFNATLFKMQVSKNDHFDQMQVYILRPNPKDVNVFLINVGLFFNNELVEESRDYGIVLQ